jgi:hypothetical protein
MDEQLKLGFDPCDNQNSIVKKFQIVKMRRLNFCHYFNDQYSSKYILFVIET